MRILLVEDDTMLGAALLQALRDASYAVDWVTDGEMAAQTLKSGEHPLVLLDLGLPGKSGMGLLQSLRAGGNAVAVLIITARDALDDRIAGLDHGADDYLVKPFDIPELLARLRAIIRRISGQSTPLLGNGVLTLDPVTRIASTGGVEYPLTAREYALLHALVLRPGAILSRDQLEQRVYGWGEEVESNAVEFLIHSLRKKLGRDIIKNVRGLGWRVQRE